MMRFASRSLQVCSAGEMQHAILAVKQLQQKEAAAKRAVAAGGLPRCLRCVCISPSS
jgi:hypothetical protein